MATVLDINENNLVKWLKVEGSLTLADLRASGIPEYTDNIVVDFGSFSFSEDFSNNDNNWDLDGGQLQISGGVLENNGTLGGGIVTATLPDIYPVYGTYTLSARSLNMTSVSGLPTMTVEVVDKFGTVVASISFTDGETNDPKESTGILIKGGKHIIRVVFDPTLGSIFNYELTSLSLIKQ
jgi:hypothetical protein